MLLRLLESLSESLAPIELLLTKEVSLLSSYSRISFSLASPLVYRSLKDIKLAPISNIVFGRSVNNIAPPLLTFTFGIKTIINDDVR